jgi:hypothetical protein
VMTSDQNADLPVAESMIVSFYDEKTRQWREVGRTQNSVTIKPGKRRIVECPRIFYTDLDGSLCKVLG